ncbi:MAG TPA: haloacid dehalogenase type II, partial [Mycobacterium sp.]
MAAPSVLVFDVNETLIDIESVAPLFERLFGDPQAMKEWFNQLVMYSMTATLSGHYVDFFTLGQGVLQMLASTHRLSITDDDVRELKDRMLTMPAHPDVDDGLTVLRDNGFRLATLTNSPPNPDGPTALEHAGLAHFFEQTFSVEACRAFKPAPAVYRHVCEKLAVAPA